MSNQFISQTVIKLTALSAVNVTTPMQMPIRVSVFMDEVSTKRQSESPGA